MRVELILTVCLCFALISYTIAISCVAGTYLNPADQDKTFTIGTGTAYVIGDVVTDQTNNVYYITGKFTNAATIAGVALSSSPYKQALFITKLSASHQMINYYLIGTNSTNCTSTRAKLDSKQNLIHTAYCDTFLDYGMGYQTISLSGNNTYPGYYRSFTVANFNSTALTPSWITSSTGGYAYVVDFDLDSYDNIYLVGNYLYGFALNSYSVTNPTAGNLISIFIATVLDTGDVLSIEGKAFTKGTYPAGVSTVQSAIIWNVVFDTVNNYIYLGGEDITLATSNMNLIFPTITSTYTGGHLWVYDNSLNKVVGSFSQQYTTMRGLYSDGANINIIGTSTVAAAVNTGYATGYLVRIQLTTKSLASAGTIVYPALPTVSKYVSYVIKMSSAIGGTLPSLPSGCAFSKLQADTSEMMITGYCQGNGIIANSLSTDWVLSGVTTNTTGATFYGKVLKQGQPDPLVAKVMGGPSSVVTNIKNCLQVGFLNTTNFLSLCPSASGNTLYMTVEQQCSLNPPGTFSNDKAATSTPCPLGTYAPSNGTAYNCTQCPAGYYAPSTGSSRCIMCPSGYGCTSATAVQCGPGTYSSNGTCVSCPPGTYSNKTALSTMAGCIQCANGTFSTVVGAATISTCQTCTYRTVSNIGNTMCFACGIGYYRAISNDGCLICSNTSYCPPGTATPSIFPGSWAPSIVQPSAAMTVYSDDNSILAGSPFVVFGLLFEFVFLIVGIFLVVLVWGLMAILLKIEKTRWIVRRVDFIFNMHHMVRDQESPVCRFTYLGGFFSACFFILILVIVGVTFFRFGTNNSQYTQVLSPNSLSITSGTHFVQASFYTGDLNNCNGTVTTVGFVNGTRTTRWYLSQNKVDNTPVCIAEWTCSAPCVLYGISHIVQFNLQIPGASSVGYDYQVIVPYLRGQTFNMTSSRMYSDPGTVFRGSSNPFIVNILATPTQLVVNDNEIWPTPANSPKYYGIMLQLIGTAQGSEVDNTNFLSQPDTVGIQFQFVVSSSSLIVTEVQIQTLLGAIGQIGGLVSTVFAFFRILYPRVEQIVNIAVDNHLQRRVVDHHIEVELESPSTPLDRMDEQLYPKSIDSPTEESLVVTEGLIS